MTSQGRSNSCLFTLLFGSSQTALLAFVEAPGLQIQRSPFSLLPLPPLFLGQIKANAAAK